MKTTLSRSGAKRRHIAVTYVALVICAIAAIFPIVFMIVSSLKTDKQIFADLGTWRMFLPVGEISLANYEGVMTRVPVAHFLLNSVIVTVGIVVLGLLVNSMAGFAISRMRWRGKSVILTAILATLMVPFETIAVPLVLWVTKLPLLTVRDGALILKEGMLNSYQVQILPFIANALAIFLFVQHFSTLPKEIDEAARIDGAGWFRIYWSVVAPMSGPTFATVAIITMLPAWNQYLWPLMVVQKEAFRPATVGLQYLFQLDTVWGEVMAYAALVTIPVLIAFVAFQRAFVSSLASAAVKG